MFISEKNIKKLIKLVEDSDIDSIEVSSWGRRIRINQRGSSNGHSSAPATLQSYSAPTPAPQAVSSGPTPAPAAAATETAAEDTGRLVEIKSPMVGTFYAAPSPESPPYVSPNAKVNAGQVVCIVEAMKLMNEIESEVSGRVAKVLVENSQPVEFDQVLFLIDPEG